MRENNIKKQDDDSKLYKVQFMKVAIKRALNLVALFYI